MSEKKHSARPLAELDKGSRENLERITALSPQDMNVHDRKFMKARADYLTSDQIADYVENPDLPDLEEETEEAGKYDAMTVPDLEEETEEAGKYDAMTVPELKEEMVKRGVKADLIAALEADDAAE